MGRAATFLPFAGICALCWFGLFVVVPETRGKSLEDIQREIGALFPLASDKLQGERPHSDRKLPKGI